MKTEAPWWHTHTEHVQNGPSNPNVKGEAMHDFVCLGPTPCEESCACVGEEDYRERALEECRRFIQLLRKTFGPEPDGARLSLKWFDHDFGPYCEVVCHFNTELPESVDYAFRCESDAPATWEG
jgi:hypothetical protein